MQFIGCGLMVGQSFSTCIRMTTAMQLEATASPGLEFQQRLLNRHVSQTTPYAKWLKTDNLKLFRQTFNKFIDIFEEVVKLQTHDDAVEIFNNLVKLRSHEWKAMEAGLASADSETCVLRNRESQVVITVLQSMVSNLESFITAAQCKLEDHTNDIEITCRREISRLHEEVHTLRKDLCDVRWWHNEDKTALRHAQREVLQLKSALKDKNDRIRQLERDSNVQLWEEEKQKLVTKYQNKIEELEKEKRKPPALKSTPTLEIPNGNSKVQSGDGADDSNVEALERNLWLMEKDIRNHARCLRQFQSRCTAVVHGFKIDFEKFTDRLIDEHNALNDRARGAIKNLQDRLKAIAMYTASDSVDDLSSFPHHYHHRVNCKPIKLERESQPCKKLPTTPSPRHSVCLDSCAGLSPDADSTSLFEFPPAPNPELLNWNLREINYDAVMRYFPQMTKEYIEEQWEQFTKFDKNNDHSLDLNEMMGAMYATTGHEFNPREIKEAMLEADLDGSNTIDFFEFLNVANMLRKKSGQSVIASHLVSSKQRKNLSKTCSIQ